MLNPLKILSKFIKSHNQKQLDKLQTILDKVNNFESEISKINDADFPDAGLGNSLTNSNYICDLIIFLFNITVQNLSGFGQPFISLN